MIINFFKLQGQWFADLPEYIASGGELADCAMVAGADNWLDIIAQGEDEIGLEISTDPESTLPERIDLISSHEEDGAFYVANYYKDIYYDLTLWLCPVTLFVFGEYPRFINYVKI